VDVSLNTKAKTSVRQYPFNATDSLTLIGGREAAKKAATGEEAMRKKKISTPRLETEGRLGYPDGLYSAFD